MSGPAPNGAPPSSVPGSSSISATGSLSAASSGRAAPRSVSATDRPDRLRDLRTRRRRSRCLPDRQSRGGIPMAAAADPAVDYEAIMHHVWSQLRDLADEAYAAGCGDDDPARRAYASGVEDLA